MEGGWRVEGEGGKMLFRRGDFRILLPVETRLR